MTLRISRSVVLLLLVVSTVLGEGDTTNTNSCTSPDTVLEGETAALTCIYSQNVESDKQDFYIFRSQNDEEPVIVVICAWDTSSYQLNCDIDHGNYNITVHAHRVILNISSAQPVHAGNYSCSTLPPAKDQRIEQCSLAVQAKTTTDTISIVCNKDVRQPSVMCMFSESMDATTILLERHGLLNSKPVEVMRCDKKSERCTSPLNGYKITTSEKPGNIKVYGVMFPLDAADTNGLYVCKTLEGSSRDMCMLKTDEVPPQPDTDDKIVQTLIVPLYLIFAVMVVIVIISGVIVLKRCKFKHHQERPAEQLSEPEPEQVQLNPA